MSRKLRIAYFAHSLRSDWNNGNAHFLRGLMRGMRALGHDAVVFEPRAEWSVDNLLLEPRGQETLRRFEEVYPDLQIELYETSDVSSQGMWQQRLGDFDVVVLHEWNPPALSAVLLEVREYLGYRMLFHDTHHRASSSPEQIRLFGVDKFDGVVAFGEVLRRIYRERFGINRVWTLHEAADVSVFRPVEAQGKQQDVVWIGNWGDDERSEEIRQFFLRPAAEIPEQRFSIFGVRYPEGALRELCHAHVNYGGYLPNLEAPRVYSESLMTVHVPRQEYARVMTGIPTIRVFEALACGIPLISAPWNDAEGLFRSGDFAVVRNGAEMADAMRRFLEYPDEAAAQAERGLETVLDRHTCAHRAAELDGICEEVLR
ncbi:CgeB family protein [Occallatibacter riparius]|uniref:Glycosyltransferase n=1 Tax=Occallatibacter riparius TaxID=1002689 RepID=A0A9J7BVP7_9BACT|nr:glycosyltransferase [Occallatibacter riparius]UWZ86947.1 glycosyltransferase [Occallatibacter riparius]